MATFYSNWTSVSNPDISLRIKIITTFSQNTSANTSTVTAKQYIESANYVAYSGAGSISGSTDNHILNLGGSSYSNNDSFDYNSNGSKLIQTRTKTITHNSYGNGSYSIGGSCSAMILKDEGYFVDTSLSISNRTIALPTINRTSSITSNATSSTEFGNTINFTITRYNSNFTHDISYSVYSANGTIATGVATSQSWEIPTSLIASTPDNANPVITITCVTKNGSATIGSSQHTFNCKVPDSYVPTCSLSLDDVGTVPSEWGIWLKSKSVIKGTIEADGSAGSTIKSYISTANENTYAVNPFTTMELKKEGEHTVTSTVTDSRGRTASDSKDIEVVDYFPPTIVMCKVERCLVNGTLSEEGTYGKATIQFKIAPINNGTTNLNDKKIKINYGATEIEETATNYEDTVIFATLIEGIEANASYNFIFSVIDSFESFPQTFTLPPAFVTQSLLAGGRGITYGQVATEEGVISHMNTKFYKNNWVKNQSVDGLKTEKYSENIWIVYVEDDE